MDLQITQEDVQAVLNDDPIMALKVQNRALVRQLEATTIAFDTAMAENARLKESLSGEDLDAQGRKEALPVHGEGEAASKSSR
jgi:hypothetical protein